MKTKPSPNHDVVRSSAPKEQAPSRKGYDDKEAESRIFVDSIIRGSRNSRVSDSGTKEPQNTTAAGAGVEPTPGDEE